MFDICHCRNDDNTLFRTGEYREDGTKKAKIGIAIKKSPNSDRSFESRLLDQDQEEPPVVLKNKRLDVW